jgi:hypothetical protein
MRHLRDGLRDFAAIGLLTALFVFLAEHPLGVDAYRASRMPVMGFIPRCLLFLPLATLLWGCFLTLRDSAGREDSGVRDRGR